MLLSPYLLHDSSVDLLQYDHASLRNSELDLALQKNFTRAEAMDDLPWPADDALSKQIQGALSLLS